MTNRRHRLVIVGGSDAGIAAGMRAHELDPSIEPLVVVAEAYPNFSICGLPFYLSGETPDWRDLAHRSRSVMEAAGLRFLLDHTATQIDADRHTLTVRDPDGDERAIGYDTLIVGTGAVPARPPIDGLDAPGVHVLHSMDHVFAVHDRVTLPSTRRAIIVGAGYIGLELADAFSHRGLDVTVIEMLDQVLATVDTELAGPLRDTLPQHGVTVATGVTVHAIEPDGTALRVISDDDVDRPADIVVVAAGVRPNTALAQTAGVALGQHGAIIVDRHMRTDVPDIYAAGDCVETRLSPSTTTRPTIPAPHRYGSVSPPTPTAWCSARNCWATPTPRSRSAATSSRPRSTSG